MVFAFFVISMFIVSMDVDPPAPIAAVLAVAVAVPLCRFRFQKSIFGWVVVHSPFEFGASLPSYPSCALETFGRALAMFLSCEVSRLAFLTSLLTLMPANIRVFLFVFDVEVLFALILL